MEQSILMRGSSSLGGLLAIWTLPHMWVGYLKNIIILRIDVPLVKRLAGNYKEQFGINIS